MLALLAAALPALAERPTYNEVGMMYGRAAEGYQDIFANANFELGQNVVLGIVYQKTKADNAAGSHYDLPGINVLYHTPLADNLDWTATAQYSRARYEWRNYKLKDNVNNYQAAVGVKYRPIPALQIHPTIGYTHTAKGDYTGTSGSPYVDVNASYDFHRHFGIKTQVGLQKAGSWYWSVGPRATW